MRRSVKGLSLVVAGILAGTMLLTPVGAHITQSGRHVGVHAWREFIRERVYTRTAANRIFYTRTAANAIFQSKCQDGSVLGYATVAASNVFSSTFTDAGVVGFSCASSDPVLAKRAFNAGTNDATYTVRFPGLNFGSTTASNVQITTVAASGQVAGVYGTSGGDVTVQTFQDVTGDAIDKAFSLTIFRAG